MKDDTGCRRGFSLLSKTWYGPASLSDQDEISDRVDIGLYSPDGGTTGEFHVIWERLGEQVVPKLSAYDDSWSALFDFSDLLAEMAKRDSQQVSPAAFCEMLVALGIADRTRIELDD